VHPYFFSQACSAFDNILLIPFDSSFVYIRGPLQLSILTVQLDYSMSDPISVAKTAASIVSLELSLCKILVDYFEALKCRREEIESISGQIDGLRSAFVVI
jgi:hypothetical protein